MIRYYLILLIVLKLTIVNCFAQNDYTSLIANPGFETGSSSGWAWSGTNNHVWIGVNTDGDATKTGSYIAGTWNAIIGDVELSQTITELDDGYYRITADLMGSSNSTTSRLTTQRLFANNKCMLFGSAEEMSYSEANIGLLGKTEEYFFGNYTETQSDRGPFLKLSVVVKVNDGTLKFGIRSNGKATSLGYTFPHLTHGDGYGWFKVDNFQLHEVSKVATLHNIALNTGKLDQRFTSDNTEYTATLPVGATSVTPIITVSAQGQTITGGDPVDVSSGSGKSEITVTSIDGTESETYIINYTVLDQAPETIVAFNKTESGVEFDLVTGKMNVQVCSDKIIRVRYTSEEELPTGDTIIVNREWEPVDFSVSEQEKTITVSTASLELHINKGISQISYFDKDGNQILTESSKTVEPAYISAYDINTNTCEATFNSPSNEAIYGLGQHQQRVMNFKGKTQSLDQQNGEIALPFLVSSYGYGLLWDNYSKSQFLGNKSSNTQYAFTSESGDMVDYYFIYGPAMDDLISEYRYATGTAPLFPKWSYGLFQSKDKYTSSEELWKMGNDYRKARIPVDCIVQDWDYWTPDVWGSNTVNSGRYPDPVKTVDSLHAMDLHTMISIWPVFHQSCNNYKEYQAINALYPSNGSHHFYDPHNEAAREIYWNQVNSQLFSAHGWDAWWADNNEPQGWPDAFDRKNFTTAKGSAVSWYNTYPITHVSGFYKGWRRDIPNKRAFILSRSAFSGQQRYGAASWSGDIHSNWTDFRNQFSAGLNFCLSGIPYWTTDIGGYWITDWSTPNNNELMVRWLQYGAFCPLFRIHGKGDKSMVSTQNLTNNTIDVMARYDKLRYRLMPYIYSLAWKVTDENYTIMRHLIMEYRNDDKVKNIDDQFFFGPSLMISPIASLGQRSRNTYLPEGEWFNFWTGEKLSGGITIEENVPLDMLSIYVKAGAIIPMGPAIQHTGEATDTIEFRVYQGADGEFKLYEDAGDTYNYEKGEYIEIPLSYNDASKELTIGTQTGSYPDMLTERVFKIIWVDAYYGTGLNFPVKSNSVVSYTGQQVVVSYNDGFKIPKIHYEAEDAILTGTAKVSNSNSYYSGAGYVDGLNLSNTAAIEFDVDAPSKGIYQINLRYSASSARRSLAMEVNENEIILQQCNKTRNDDTWGYASYIAPLSAGSNAVKFIGDSSAVAIDYIELSQPEVSTLYLTEEKICKMRPLNQQLYLENDGSELGLNPLNTTSEAQNWTVTKISKERFRITSNDNDKCLAVINASTSEGSEIITEAAGSEACQQWIIKDLGEGVFEIISHLSQLSLGVDEDGNLVQQKDVQLGSQRWVLEEFSSSISYQPVYEPFDYPLGEQLNQLGAKGNGWGGSWTVYEGNGDDFSIQESVDQTGLSSKGNRLTGTLSSSTGLRAYRTLEPVWEDDGEDIWLSFLMEIDNPNSIQNSWHGVSLFTGSSEHLLIGKDWGKSTLGLVGYGAGSFESAVSAFTGIQHLIVCKIETSGDQSNENVFMWIDPSFESEPDVAEAAISKPISLNSGFERIVCHLGNTIGVSCSYDEIRLAKSFEEIKNMNNSVNYIHNSCSLFKAVVDVSANCIQLTYHSDAESNTTINIFNVNGSRLYEKKTNSDVGLNSETIQLEHLALERGIYIVNILSAGFYGSQKVIL